MVRIRSSGYGDGQRPASGDISLSDAFQIRPATTGDIDFLEACAADAYAQYFEAIGRKPAPMVFDFEAQLGEMPIEMMMNDGGSVGYLVWHLRADHLFLESIAVTSAQQGRGFAGLAMAYLEKTAIAAGRKAIELYTNEKMTANLGLYPHLGFVEIERREEEGFNRIYFRKILK
ncbi:MAG: GNAT family N-acetyltransferase [Rhizobiaceae bacterium]